MSILIEIIGYLGMVIVFASFLAKDIKLVRIINMVGSLLCLTYGILTLTLPTAILNGGLFLLNASMLLMAYYKEKKSK